MVEIVIPCIINEERRVIRMDLGTWSPSHTILVLVVLVAFIGQVAVYFYRTAQNDKKIERLEELMDKRFVEVISTMNQQISVVRSEISVVRSEISVVRSERCARGNPRCPIGDEQTQPESCRSPDTSSRQLIGFAQFASLR